MVLKNLSKIISTVGSIGSGYHIEVMPQEKQPQQTSSSKKHKNLVPYQNSLALINREKWFFSVIPTEGKVVRPMEQRDMKMVEANIKKDPINKTIRDATWDKNAKTEEIITNLEKF